MCQIEETTSRRIARSIFKFFLPLISSHAGVTEKDALKSSIRELAADAFKLAMTIRKSKERYTFKTLERGSEMKHLVQANDSWVEPEAVEGGKNSDGSDEIAYTLFGALVKYSEGREIVLDRAPVVLKRKY